MKVYADCGIIADVVIDHEIMSELVSPAFDIFHESSVVQQSDVVTFHQALSFEPEHGVSSAENDEKRDLRDDSSIRGRTLGRLQEDISLVDRLQLCGNRWTAVSNTEVMIEHIE